MKKLLILVGLGVVMSMGFVSARSSNTLTAVIASRPELSTLMTALNKAGLTKDIDNNGPYTIFAPTNAAFAALPKGRLNKLLASPKALASLLQNHVVAGNYTLAKLESLPATLTLSGRYVDVKSCMNKAMVGKAMVRHANIATSDGRIDIINKVLIN